MLHTPYTTSRRQRAIDINIEGNHKEVRQSGRHGAKLYATLGISSVINVDTDTIDSFLGGFFKQNSFRMNHKLIVVHTHNFLNSSIPLTIYSCCCCYS